MAPFASRSTNLNPSQIHPYVKLALSTLSWAAHVCHVFLQNLAACLIFVQAILNQTILDQSVTELLSKIGHVYAFVMEDDTIVKVDLIRAPLGELAKLLLKYVEFIETYAKAKSFWKRLKDNAFSDCSNIVAIYNSSLDLWTQRCRDLILGKIHRDVIDVLGPVNRIQQVVGQTLDKIRHIERGIEHIEDETYLNKLAYANGAGLDGSKTCLENTDVHPVGDRELGKGKSAIAHTITKWFEDLGELGSCFCFAQDQLADLRHKKIFATIARDLSDHNPDYKRALAGIVSNNASSLIHTPDIKQHWRKFILEPLSELATGGGAPVVIVIDALDESGDNRSRESILDVLSSVEPASLPPNIRILVTSRPLNDIAWKLGNSTCVKRKSMDEISVEITKRNIQMYVSHKLDSSGYGLPENAVADLAEMSDGLFEWARLACEFIASPEEAATPMELYDDPLLGMDRGGAGLLDSMYEKMLGDMVGKSERTHSRFCSVMRQILWTKEPLSMDALNALRLRFPREGDRYDVNLILRSVGALLSGTVDGCTPVRPLHAFFYDFLTDPCRGGKFVIEVGNINIDLAFASLRVMQDGLYFNMCQLESSYLKNSQVQDLDGRIKKNIPSHLSYACQFWVGHVKERKFHYGLGKEVEAFCDDKLLFWMEALSLLRVLNIAASSLTGIAQWMNGGFKETNHVQQAEFHCELGKEVEAFFKEKLLFWMEALSLLRVFNIAAAALAGGT
ncbi:hypothetical protein ID866_8019 [Astraeus odoratus]|nr:hypothetical protein ID866_8019 [Astraeus odoratus]